MASSAANFIASVRPPGDLDEFWDDVWPKQRPFPWTPKLPTVRSVPHPRLAFTMFVTPAWTKSAWPVVRPPGGT